VILITCTSKLCSSGRSGILSYLNLRSWPGNYFAAASLFLRIFRDMKKTSWRLPLGIPAPGDLPMTSSLRRSNFTTNMLAQAERIMKAKFHFSEVTVLRATDLTSLMAKADTAAYSLGVLLLLHLALQGTQEPPMHDKTPRGCVRVGGGGCERDGTVWLATLLTLLEHLHRSFIHQHHQHTFAFTHWPG
jgi:hypothetical protein